MEEIEESLIEIVKKELEKEEVPSSGVLDTIDRIIMIERQSHQI